MGSTNGFVEIFQNRTKHQKEEEKKQTRKLIAINKGIKETERKLNGDISGDKKRHLVGKLRRYQAEKNQLVNKEKNSVN